jgi:hypothetical protein
MLLLLLLVGMIVLLLWQLMVLVLLLWLVLSVLLNCCWSLPGAVRGGAGAIKPLQLPHTSSCCCCCCCTIASSNTGHHPVTVKPRKPMGRFCIPMQFMFMRSKVYLSCSWLPVLGCAGMGSVLLTWGALLLTERL